MYNLIRKYRNKIAVGLYKELDKKLHSKFYPQDSKTIFERYFLFARPLSENIDQNFLKNKTLEFVKSMNLNDKIYLYKYSPNNSESNIYSSCYACMTKALYGDLNNLSNVQKQDWVNYFDSFQSKQDGLFYDTSLINENYHNSDWWGARHLALHLIVAYHHLGRLPKYEFSFLNEYLEKDKLVQWIESNSWSYEEDFDNQIMNIGCLLQYARDFFKSEKAGKAVEYLKEILIKKINPETGLFWPTKITSQDKSILSRAVQYSYHIYSIFTYDNWDNPHIEKLVNSALDSQNPYGGYGMAMNSSACEDIDSIEILARAFQSHGWNYRTSDIIKSLNYALTWILTNMNDDGGFVFRRNDSFQYGHQSMSSIANESNMFATWFRTLSLGYLLRIIKPGTNYNFKRTPGLEF